MSTVVNENGKRLRAEDDDGNGQPKIRDADAPFNSSTTDCILRSADNVDFRVHKLVLSLASPVFESMFSLPGPNSHAPNNAQERRDALPVITLPEESAVLDPLLRLCYPTTSPTLTQLSKTMILYDALDKYAMDTVLPAVQEFLVRDVVQNPMVAYVFGCRYRVQALITAAAKATLTTPIDDLPYCPEIESISAGQLYRLHEYHRACQKAASDIPIQSHWSWLSISDIPLGTSSRHGCACRSVFTAITGAVRGSVHNPTTNRWDIFAASWWWDFLKDAEAALKTRPRGSTVTDKKLLAPTLKKASACRNAGCQSGIQDLLDFSQLLAEQVEATLDTVNILSDLGEPVGWTQVFAGVLLRSNLHTEAKQLR